MSRIEQVIEEIESYIDSCKYQTLSNSKIIVNRDELDDLIADLKHCIPEEVKKYQRIIANRDAILKDAQDKAEEMIKKANEMTVKLVSEHEIMQKAYSEANNVVQEATAKANGMLDSAQAEANAIRTAAVQYTDDSLGMIQDILSSSIDGVSVRYDSMMEALKRHLEVTIQNRKQLHPTGDDFGISDVDSADGIQQYDPNGVDVSEFIEN